LNETSDSNGFIARAGCQSEEPLTACPGYEGINSWKFRKKMLNGKTYIRFIVEKDK
jgi:hypothetical protein